MNQKVSKKLIFFLILMIIVLTLTGCFSEEKKTASSNESLEVDYFIDGKEEKEETSESVSLLTEIREKIFHGKEKQKEEESKQTNMVSQEKEDLSFWEKLKSKYSNNIEENKDKNPKKEKLKEEKEQNLTKEPEKINNFSKQKVKSEKKDDKDDKDKKDKKDENKHQDVEQKKPKKKPEKTKKETVTITIRCDTAVDKGMADKPEWQGIVPPDGIILSKTTLEIKEGDTVLNVLERARDKYKFQMQYSGDESSAYIEGINNLYEFDGGRWSGWMYCVNDWYPNYGCGVYVLQSGDVIEWNYTCNLGKDLGQDWLSGE